MTSDRYTATVASAAQKQRNVTGFNLSAEACTEANLFCSSIRLFAQFSLSLALYRNKSVYISVLYIVDPIDERDSTYSYCVSL